MRLQKLAESKKTVDMFLNTASSGLMTEYDKRKLGIRPGISQDGKSGNIEQIKEEVRLLANMWGWWCKCSVPRWVDG